MESRKDKEGGMQGKNMNKTASGVYIFYSNIYFLHLHCIFKTLVLFLGMCKGRMRKHGMRLFH